jgi:UDP-N-acetylglucosamine 2-epimerase (non-hydrolysing)
MSRENRPIMIVAGTRPEAIKLAPVIWSLDKLGVDYVFVWSGQHYDYEMSRVFFNQLGLPDPDLDLDVRSGSHAEQTARIMIGVEKAIIDYKPSIVVAQGDTNTTLASALASVKSLTPFAHVEAGLRSWDKTMPEEVNRVVADSIAELNFAPTWLAAVNLMHSGVPLKKIYVTGNTIVDVVYKYKDLVVEWGEKLLGEYKLEPGNYALVTIHRQENTDNQWRLENIVKALIELSKHIPVVFPAHPRTTRRLEAIGLLESLKKNVKLLSPLGYFEFLGLLSKSAIVLTDSGGVQEEACILGIPTLTLRYNTERPETVLAGTNILVGVEAENILEKALETVNKRRHLIERRNRNELLGDGRAGERIASTLRGSMGKVRVEDNDIRFDPYILHALVDSNGQGCNYTDLIALYDERGMPVLDPSKAAKKLVRISRSDLLKCLENR